MRRLANAATLGGAALVVWSAFIHLHLWSEGYRHIPNIGHLFLAQGVLGFAIAVGVLAVRQALTALVGAAYLAVTSACLLLSATIGLFSFHDGLDAPYAGLSLAVELIGLVLFSVAAAAAAPSCTKPGRRRGTRRSVPLPRT
jgi:hypothetical protein